MSFSRQTMKKLGRLALEKDVRAGGHYERGVRCVMMWAGPDNHPDNWDDDWEFFHGDKDLYPEPRAFIGWVGAAGWAEDEDDGFEYFEVRTKNIQAINSMNEPEKKMTEYRASLINRTEDVEWAKSTFLELYREVFPDRDDPEIRITDVELEAPDFPSYLKPEQYR